MSHRPYPPNFFKRFIYSTRYILLAIVLIVLLGGGWLWWGLSGVAYFARHWTGKVDPTTLGQIGDIFGGINALFAALAFAGVALASFLQFETLKIVREQGARDSFEPLFFELLKQPKLPEHIEIPESTFPLLHAGTEEFHLALNNLRKAYTPKLALNGHLVDEHKIDVAAEIRVAYSAIYRNNEIALGPYFRAHFHTFKFVFQSSIPDEDKFLYASIARARLSSNEVFLLILNSLIDEGKNFRALINYYGLAKHLRKSVDAQKPTVDEFLANSVLSPSATMSKNERIDYWRKNKTELSQVFRAIAQL